MNKRGTRISKIDVTTQPKRRRKSLMRLSAILLSTLCIFGVSSNTSVQASETDPSPTATTQVQASSKAIEYKAAFPAQLTDTSSYTYTTDITITMDGVVHTPVNEDGSELRPIIVKGRIFYPIKGIADIFGATTDWDPVNSMIIVKLGDTTLETYNGSKAVVKNADQAFNIVDGFRVFIKDGIAYLPFTALTDRFGVEVSWDADAKTISITDDYVFVPLIPGEVDISVVIDGVRYESAEAVCAERNRQNAEGLNLGEYRPTEPGTYQGQMSPEGKWEWLEAFNVWTPIR